MLLCCSMEWGGSNIRPEATGYGAVYFGEEVLKEQGQDFKVSFMMQEELKHSP